MFEYTYIELNKCVQLSPTQHLPYQILFRLKLNTSNQRQQQMEKISVENSKANIRETLT